MHWKFHLCVIFLSYNVFEITGKKTTQKSKLTVNLESEADNPEFVTNGRNIVGPEIVLVGNCVPKIIFISYY